jgi:hypothetical protein
MIDWARAYSCRFAVARVDVGTWADSGTLGNVASLSIDRDCSDSVPLLEEASIEVNGDFEDGWHRVYMIAEQGVSEKIALGTFLFERKTASYDHGSVSVKADGSSVLIEAEDIELAYGEYAPYGADGARYAANMLRKAIHAPVKVSGGFTLSQNVVFSIGMSVLEAVWLVLDAGGFCIRLDGDGTVNILKKPDEPDLELSRANARLLMPGVGDDYTLTGVPNRYKAIDDGQVAVAVNEDAGSAVSYPSRGRWVDETDTSPVRVNGETLQQYAERKLKEASAITVQKSYTREYWPGVRPFSIVRGSMADVGLSGDFTVVSQSLECDRGVTVQETVQAEVSV